MIIEREKRRLFHAIDNLFRCPQQAIMQSTIDSNLETLFEFFPLLNTSSLLLSNCRKCNSVLTTRFYDKLGGWRWTHMQKHTQYAHHTELINNNKTRKVKVPKTSFNSRYFHLKSPCYAILKMVNLELKFSLKSGHRTSRKIKLFSRSLLKTEAKCVPCGLWHEVF